MRYLIDPEFRAAPIERAGPRVGPGVPPRGGPGRAGALRGELGLRNRAWAREHGFAHEETLGGVPAVLYAEDEAGRHGNFLAKSYEAIQGNPLWAKRLTKVHTTGRRALLSRDAGRKELDSSSSSDALLMNIFCHPATLRSAGVRRMLGVGEDAMPEFGVKPRVALKGGRRDCTEIDMKLGDLLVEAKLTEFDFQRAPVRLVERYVGIDEVFDLAAVERVGECVESYQLIRGVMAAHGSGLRFGVVCDARRPDLLARWYSVMQRVRLHELRCRLFALTWQELAVELPRTVGQFLAKKYGIDGR